MAKQTISIRQIAEADGGRFEVAVGFEGRGEHRVSVSDPLADDSQRELLTWYFETHLELPFLDRDRADAAEELIADYGAALCADLFESNAECAHELRRARDAGLDGWRVEVIGSTAFHRLHWEALRSPDVGDGRTPIGILVPIIRRVEHVGGGFDVQPTGTALNVLLVTARPGGLADVGYRTISRPLLESLRQARVPVNVDLVRPGSWSALVERLREATAAHGSGWYQVIHFDVHGSVATGDELAALRNSGYRFSDDAVAQAAPGDAFLYFETNEDGVAEPVATQRVADLLVEHRVPVAIMNACQSAMQPGGSEASLAQRLVEAGVPLALGMAYSVTVSAAELMMPVVYERLARGDDVLAAIHDSRRALFDRRARRVYFDHALDLEDWLLPVVFAQRDVEVQPRPATVAETAAIWERQANRIDEPHPEYGFVGRDLDVQAIERAVLADDGANELLIRGMAGAGKSTLLEHLGWWWQTTGLVDHVFSYSYEDRAWTASQILHSIAAELLEADDLAAFHTLSDDAQLKRIEALLRAERHLLVLDNAESITADGDSVPHALAEREQQRIGRLLARLRGGRTIVLIGSRGAERWVASKSFGRNVHALGGLDPQATSVLVDRVFSRNGIGHPTAPEQRAALAELLRALGGYPLMLTVVLPSLASATAEQVLEELAAGGTGADPDRMIERAIEVSYRRLNPAAQNALLCLAPFASTVKVDALESVYSDLLAERPAVAALGPLDLRGAIDDAIRVGLAYPHATFDQAVRLQPVLPYFLHTRLRGREDLAAELAEAHYRLYMKAGIELYRLLMATDPLSRRIGRLAAEAEYANLASAIDHALATGQVLGGPVGILDEYLNQTKQWRARRALLDKAIAGIGSPESSERRRELATLHDRAGVAAAQERRFDAAKDHHSRELALLEQAGERRPQGLAHHQLGMVAQEQRRFDDATGHFEAALEIFREFDDRGGMARSHHQLGLIAQQRGRLEEAEEQYREALQSKDELDAPLDAARTRYQLGMVAEHRGEFEQAGEHYREALKVFAEFDDHLSVATCHQQLGAVAHRQRQMEQAERHYREALAVMVQIGDAHSIAIAYNLLGMLLHQVRRFEEAERQLGKALETFVELDDVARAGVAYKHLAEIAAEDDQRLEEAEANYRKALANFIEVEEFASVATTSPGLTLLLTRAGRIEEAIEVTLGTLFASQKVGNKLVAAGALAMLKTQIPLVGRERFRGFAANLLGPGSADGLLSLVDSPEVPGLEDLEDLARDTG